MDLACLPEGRFCFLRTTQEYWEAETLGTKLKYSATQGKDAMKSLGR
jgi:hypothetical protein